MGVPKTFPAATLALSLVMKSARDGGQVLGIATPLAPTPVPVLMLKTGTRVGSICVTARASLFVGKAEAWRKRREKRVVVVRNCILDD